MSTNIGQSELSHQVLLSGLEELYKKYHDQGLEIIGFPCNQVSRDLHTGVLWFVTDVLSLWQLYVPSFDRNLTTSFGPA